MTTPSSVLAGIFALAAFAVAIVAGLAAGNEPAAVLGRAVLAMTVCYPVGFAVGLVCHRILHDHVEKTREEMNAEVSAALDADSSEAPVSETEIDDDSMAA